MLHSVRTKRCFLGRLAPGDDLVEALAEFARRHRVRCGFFGVVGAVRKAVIAYYDQDRRKYCPPVILNKHLEIASCLGNVSLKDGQPFVHAHGVFADRRGRTFAGHCMPGIEIFAAEVFLQEVSGAKFIRTFDAPTGLSLWD